MAELIPVPSSASIERRRSGGKLIKVLIYLGAAVGLFMVAGVIMIFRMTKSIQLRAFRVPSNSMCPAICLNERIIAGMDAFNGRPPERGEVILFVHPPGGQRFLKRVVAVGGDTVAPGPEDTILVNGKPAAWPVVCGDPVRDDTPSGEQVEFKALTVPKGSYFVVGDNVNHSLDSRYPGYGLVQRDMVEGKALFIYWSSGTSRIGCSIR
jgi:signal peptidase I